MIRGTSYRESHVAPDKGASYAREFRESRWLRYLWNRERALLYQVLQEQQDHGRVRLLDFACGTGRILKALADRVEVAVGVDVSESMINVARKEVPRANLHLVDITCEPCDLGGPFDLITAFRFFPNAEPDLRIAAMKALVEHLSPNGKLIFNNHQNASSTHYQVGRLLRRKWSKRAMSIEECIALIDQAGLKSDSAHAFGVLPASSRRFIFPRWVHLQADALARKLHCSTTLAQDVVFVCSK